MSSSRGLYVPGVAAAPVAGPGLAGCDPSDYLLLGPPLAGADEELGAFPVRDVDGRVLWLPGEHRLGVWHAATAAAARRAPGGIREEAWLSWAGRRTPVVMLTNRRIVLRGGRRDPVAHIALERLIRVRAVRRRRRSTVDLEVLLHCARSGATGELTLRLVLAPRRATALVRAIAAAHRGRWRSCAVPAPVAAAVAGAQPRRLPRELRYDAAVHVPLGMTDAIRGPGATTDVPQRMRTAWAEAASQAARAG